MSRSVLRSAWTHPLGSFVLGALGCCLVIDCSGGGAIDLGNSGGDGQQSGGAAGAFCQNAGAPNSDGPCGNAGAPGAGAANACSGLSCVTPCGYTSDVENGGATGVLFCDLQGECVSILPHCHGDSDGAGGAAAGSSFGGAAGSSFGGATTAGASLGGGAAAGVAAGAGSGGI